MADVRWDSCMKPGIQQDLQQFLAKNFQQNTLFGGAGQQHPPKPRQRMHFSQSILDSRCSLTEATSLARITLQVAKAPTENPARCMAMGPNMIPQ